MTTDLKKLAEVKRYTDYGGMIDCETGERVEICGSSGQYVRYSDHQAACTALQNEVDNLKHDISRSVATNAELATDNAALRQEVETLREAAKQWADLYSATLTELRYFSAPGTTKETDGPLLARQLRDRAAHARQEALEEAAKVCDAEIADVTERTMITPRIHAVREIAVAIRALQPVTGHTGDDMPVRFVRITPEALERLNNGETVELSLKVIAIPVGQQHTGEVPGYRRYNFDRFNNGQQMAEGIAVHALNMEEAEGKAKKLMRNDTGRIQFRDNSPCPKVVNCTHCAALEDGETKL